jgi:hypothetical protein
MGVARCCKLVQGGCKALQGGCKQVQGVCNVLHAGARWLQGFVTHGVKLSIVTSIDVHGELDNALYHGGMQVIAPDDELQVCQPVRIGQLLHVQPHANAPPCAMPELNELGLTASAHSVPGGLTTVNKFADRFSLASVDTATSSLGNFARRLRQRLM